MKDHLPNFKNKLVSLGVEGDAYGHPIESPRWEKQGGRLFLVGKVPAGGSTRDWCKGKTSAIAWDQVRFRFGGRLPTFLKKVRIPQAQPLAV